MMNDTSSIPKWGIRLINRLGQLKQPGIYHIVIIVDEQGNRQLGVIQTKPAKLEDLSNRNRDG